MRQVLLVKTYKVKVHTMKRLGLECQCLLAEDDFK